MNQKNNIWFDSPLIKSSCPFNPPIIKQNLQNDPQESNNRPQIIQLQEQTSSIFKFNTHPLSPWSSCINPHNDRLSSQKRPPQNYRQEDDNIQEINQQIMNYSDAEQEDLATPVRQNSIEQDKQNSQIHATGKKSINGKGNGNKKQRPRQKGLRQLSQKVYRIIRVLEKATYKQVAAKLVSELNQHIAIDEKQQQNIKRRVYDALNVLVSLGVLGKQGHIIRCLKNIKVKRNITQKRDCIDQLTRQLVERHFCLKKKQAKLRQTQQKYKLIQTFLERNKLIKEKQQIIEFPYIGIVYNDVQLTQKKQQLNEVVIESCVPFVLFGDIDSLKWLNQSNQSK